MAEKSVLIVVTGKPQKSDLQAVLVHQRRSNVAEQQRKGHDVETEQPIPAEDVICTDADVINLKTRV